MTATPPIRIIPGMLAAALLTLLCVINGIQFLAAAPIVGTLFLFAGVIWLAVFWAVQSQSAAALARLAIGGLAFYGAIGIIGVVPAPAVAGNSQLFTALTIEGLVMFAAVFAIAHIPFFWKRPDEAI